MSEAERWYRLGGHSMLPLTAPLRARVEPSRDLLPGDIAAFLDTGGRPVFHRVLRVLPEALITRGDTNLEEDPPVPRDALLGRVAGLRLGPIATPLPARGPLASLGRRAGLGWNRLAPCLRRLLRPAWRRARYFL